MSKALLQQYLVVIRPTAVIKTGIKMTTNSSFSLSPLLNWYLLMCHASHLCF